MTMNLPAPDYPCAVCGAPVGADFVSRGVGALVRYYCRTHAPRTALDRAAEKVARATDKRRRLLAAEGARDVAIGAAGNGADDAWYAAALAAGRRVASEREHFTSDDLWDYIPGAREGRAMGAVLVDLGRAGVCEPTERTKKSLRATCHARPKRVWKSLIWRRT